MNKVTKDARALSSGTVSYLIENVSYDQIDRVQNAFIKFCDEQEGQFSEWVSAWKLFVTTESYANISQGPYDLVEGEGAPQYTFLPATDQQLALL